MDTIRLLGVKVNIVTMEEVIKWANDQLNTSQAHQVVTLNPEMIMRTRKDQEFMNILKTTDLNIPDGVGLQMAAEFLLSPIPNVIFLRELLILWEGIKVGLDGFFGKKSFTILPERVAGIDLFLNLVEEGRGSGWRFYLLGGEENVADKAKKRLEGRYPGIQIVGAESGGIVNPRGVGTEDDYIIERINKSKAQILLVSFGAPVQEFWIKKNIGKLRNIRLAIGGGGTLDFIAGEQLRAPNFFQQHSLEWLWRLITMPNRWIRILTAFLLFPLYVAVNKYRMIKSN